MRMNLGQAISMTPGCVQYYDPDTGALIADAVMSAEGLCDAGTGGQDLLDADAAARQRTGEQIILQSVTGGAVVDDGGLFNSDNGQGAGLLPFPGLIPSPVKLKPSTSLLLLLALFSVGYVAVEAGKR